MPSKRPAAVDRLINMVPEFTSGDDHDAIVRFIELAYRAGFRAGKGTTLAKGWAILDDHGKLNGLDGFYKSLGALEYYGIDRSIATPVRVRIVRDGKGE